MNRVPFIYSGFRSREEAEAFARTYRQFDAEVLEREEVNNGVKETQIIVRVYDKPAQS